MPLQRERYVDIAKGLAIICIVLLHFDNGVIPPGPNVFIGSFMITTFYIVVGWIDAQRAKPLSIKELAKKRWRQLGIPYLWWSAIIIAFDLILFLFGYYDAYFIKREIYKTLVLRGIGTLWFLPALFGGELLWYLLRKNGWLIALGIGLIVAYQYLYGAFFGARDTLPASIVDAPFRTISNILNACICVAAGEGLLRLYRRLGMDAWGNIKVFALGILLGVLAYWCANHFPIPWLWPYAAPILGPFAILLMARAVQNSQLLNYFDYWGRNSLVLMLTHYSIVEVLCEIINEKLLHNNEMAGWTAIAFFCITMIIEYPIALLINSKAKFLLGK